jgi:hypothetical protein
MIAIRKQTNKQTNKYLYRSIQQLCLSRELLLVEFVCKLSKPVLPVDDE